MPVVVKQFLGLRDGIATHINRTDCEIVVVGVIGQKNIWHIAIFGRIGDDQLIGICASANGYRSARA